VRPAIDERRDSSLTRHLAGDPSGFVDFFDEHVNDVLRYFRTRTASGDTAADLCAETFAEALASVGSYRADRGDPGAWLFGIARNKYRNWARRADVERRARARLHVHAAVPHVDDLDLVELRADLERNLGKLETAVKRLSPGVRAAVLLRVVHEQTYAEIATALSCSEVAARVRVSRGLGALVERVSEDDFT